jgi:biopolymer transport protein ExbD
MSMAHELLDDELSEQHEINVTPFIDVMLVLLIIFMVAAPLSTVELPVDLPSASATPTPTQAEPIYVTLKADGALQIDQSEVAPAALGAGLDALTGGDRQRRILLQADRRADYGDIIDVLDRLRGAGYVQVSLLALERDSAQ